MGTLTFTVSGQIAGFTEEAIDESIFVRFQQVGSDLEGSDIGVSGPPAVVPEPASLLLLGSGLVGAAAVSRRRVK